MAKNFLLVIEYAERDRLAYLSHLETVEAMRRVVRRAQLPFAVSQGFSPHMETTFGPALPVGAGGDGEYFGVYLEDYIAPEAALERLQKMAPTNLMPLSVRYADVHADALDVYYNTSTWRAEFVGEIAVLEEAFARLCEVGFIETVKVKKGKTKVKRVEFATRLVGPPAFAEGEGGKVVMAFTTRQDNEGALRPDKFIDAALDGIEAAPQLVALTRTRLSHT